MNLRREPVITAAFIAGLVMAVIKWLLEMGYLGWSPDQMTATRELVEMFAPLIIMVLAAYWARAQVTPLISPMDTDGAQLTRADNSPTLKAQEAAKG